LEFNLAIKDSIGGWKENAHVYKTLRACSSLKMFLGDAWSPFMESIGIYNATCPLPMVCKSYVNFKEYFLSLKYYNL